MIRGLLAAVLMLLATSCVRRTEVAGGHARASRPVSSSSVDAIMRRQAINAVDAGEGDYRLKELRQRVAAEPDNLDIKLELARYYRERGALELAAEHLRLAAARFPDNESVHLELARTLRDTNLRAMAAATMEKYLARHPGASAGAHSWFAIIQDELGRFQQGEQAHRAALAVEPAADALHNNLGYNLLLQGRHEEAAAEFRKALEIAPKSEVARNNLGVALASRPEEALRQLQTGQNAATAHNNLAVVLMEQKQYAEARRELDIALGYKRDHPAVLANLMLLSELDGKPVTIPRQKSSGLLARIGRGLRKALAGDPAPPEGPRAGAAQTASIK